jgi:microcystin-dependent protein
MTVLQSINLDTEMTQASDVFLPGLVIPYAPTAAPPTGWLLCTGQAVSRTTYAALFAAIGTTYGSGDGSTTFNVPDMRGRFPAGADDMGTTRGAAGRIGTAMGASGGSQKKQLTSAHLPSHGHGIDSGAYVPSATPSTVGAHPHVYSLQHNMIPFGSAAILGFIRIGACRLAVTQRRQASTSRPRARSRLARSPTTAARTTTATGHRRVARTARAGRSRWARVPRSIPCRPIRP